MLLLQSCAATRCVAVLLQRSLIRCTHAASALQAQVGSLSSELEASQLQLRTAQAGAAA